MFDDNYVCEPKGIPLVSYYREIVDMVEPKTFTAMHYHSDFEILYITDGKAKMTINGNTFIAEKNSLILINPFEVHYGEVLSDKLSYYCIDFDLTILSLNYEEKILKEELRYVNHIVDSAFEEYIKNIHGSYMGENSGWMLCAKGNLMVVFSFLESRLVSAVPSKETEFAKRVIKYVSENYMKNITSGDVADELSYNQSYFCRMFKKQFSVKFSEYINLLRIKKAKELLENESVTQTAMLCGFSSISYFSVEFKKHCGMSPIQYMKQRKLSERF